ncbi:putative QWRF family protein [Rosa chinensis]|uniref:Putative QWRF family protein n=1 Tax=Rosa chinensis TaxID=74649 RepID=A0A2P6RLZ8_ROSCH|nr:putative QWRF family protein [Rosa chinensis]
MNWDYSNSLSGAIEALRASTLRLLVVDGARADVHNVKDAISSTVDVMQAT